MNVNYNSTFRSVNTKTAFDLGFEQATQGNGSSNPVMSVKTRYEQQLSNYLKQLPEDMDLTQIPDKYRGKISEFLTNKKAEYVRDAGILDELVVGAEDYMQTVSNMNSIKNAFENLDKQFQIYGNNKKTIIEDIENQTTSLYGENQANINLLRSIYNEEYDLKIDDSGNLSFVGDDGEIKMGDLPDYGIKDYDIASAMTKFGVDVYQNGYKSGIALTKQNPQYFQISNQLKTAIDQGGKNTLMSILHDGLVGDVVLANDPMIQQQINRFNSGEIPFAQLRDVVVDNYMSVLINQSQTGVKNRPKKSSKSSSGGGGRGTTVAERKAFKKIEMIDEAFLNLEPGGDLSSLTRMFSTSYNLIFDEEDPDVLVIEKSSGDSWNTEKKVNLNNPNAILDLYRYAGIDPSYWPSEVAKKEEDPLNPK